MGMAASQARFLGLTARKNNVEFEGQQINQQRTALSNESANYYNDLLGMSVPVPPSIDEYTKTTYTFSDGALMNQITAMIAQPDGTYTVSYLSKWQDDFTPVAAASSVINKTDEGYFIGANQLRTLGEEPTGATVQNTIKIDGKTYTVQNDAGGYFVEKPEMVPGTELCTAEEIANFEYYLFDSEYEDAQQVFKDTDGSFYTGDETEKTKITGKTEDDLVICLWDGSKDDPDSAVTLVTKNAEGQYEKEVYKEELQKVYLTETQVNSITKYPEMAGLTSEQVQNLLEEEQAYLVLLNEKYNNGDQTGEWYVRYIKDSSTGNSVPYFYKKTDVEDKTQYVDGVSINNVNCYTIGSDTKIEEVKAVEGCRVEQDTSGRYISLTIPDADGNDVTYALTTTTLTDQDAYDDAMNQYEYEKYTYDQAIQDINSKIEIVQAEDKNLELRLKQLDTEQDAISTEIDSVSKVIEKNVESSFKTFG